MKKTITYCDVCGNEVKDEFTQSNTVRHKTVSYTVYTEIHLQSKGGILDTCWSCAKGLLRQIERPP